MIDMNEVITRGIQWGVFWFMALSGPIGGVVLFTNIVALYQRPRDIEQD